ncbi:hypothetical protein GCM10010195_65890 [Kitasatospora griseola]|nr:hypothetical protein GCM10010195_65890 [Kitasatospora griseola]
MYTASAATGAETACSFCVLEHLHRALRRRDEFASNGDRRGDPRAEVPAGHPRGGSRAGRVDRTARKTTRSAARKTVRDPRGIERKLKGRPHRTGRVAQR